MADAPDNARIRELLARLDEVTEESQDLLRRIADARSRHPEWPARGHVSDLFRSSAEPSGPPTPGTQRD
jgi:hypothetical protein